MAVLNSRIATLEQVSRESREKEEGAVQELKRERSVTEQYKKYLLDMIPENESYHELMFETYAHNSDHFVNERKQAYLCRLEERKKQEKWASLEELVEVNLNLRRRLKLI